LTAWPFQQKIIFRTLCCRRDAGDRGRLVASHLICSIIRGGAAAVAEQRKVASRQSPVVSNRAPAVAQSGGHGPPDTFSPSPGAASAKLGHTYERLVYLVHHYRSVLAWVLNLHRLGASGF
jgi:hypothetical protein